MIKRFRRYLSGLAAGVVVMAGAVPAIAQVDAIEVHFKGSPSPQAGEVVVGQRTVAVEARSQTQGVDSGGMIKDITVRIQGNGGRNAGVCPASEASQGFCVTKNYETGPFGASEAASRETVSLAWDTERLTPLNGVYDVVTVARSDVPGINDAQVKVLEDVKVNNRPDTPKGFSVSSPVRGEAKLTLTWAKNPEADLTGYEVSRAVGGAGFSKIKFVGKDVTSVQDAGIPFDTPVRYQLVAFRFSPVSDDGVESSAATTSQVTIQAPPPPPSPSPSSTPAGGATTTGSMKRDLPKDLSSKLGSASPGGKAVKPVTLAAPNPITGPRRDGGSGFSRLLPFGANAPQSFVDEEFAEAVGEAIRNPGRLISREVRVNPMRFFAAAVLLLVTAGHLGRGAQTLFLSAKDAAPASSSPPVTAS